jgi:glycosyltransferase involved in cell wall biosynthesis
MRILYVTHSFPPHHWRGTEIYTFELAREISKGHEVSVLYLLDEEVGGKPQVRRGDYQGLAVIQVVKRLKPWDPEDYFFDSELDRLFTDVLSDYRPEVLHFTYFLGGFSAGFLSLAKDKAKVVATITDFAAFCPRGQLLDQDFQPCQGPRKGLRCLACLFDQNLVFQNKTLDRFAREYFPPWLSRLTSNPGLRLLQRRIHAVSKGLHGADHVIFSNSNTRRVFEKQGFSFKKSHVIDFGIDTLPYKNHKKTMSEKMRLGYIGQILPHKGLQTLAQALRAIPVDEFRLILYGSLDDPGAREFFESLHMSFGDALDHRGVFEFSRMNDALKEIDVLVVPSIWQENCPLIIKYGLATRTRMILSDVPGILAEPLNGGGIYRFPPGDSLALREIILRLMHTGDWKKPLELQEPLVTDISEHTAMLEKLYRN